MPDYDKPNPQNILSITYQLLQEISDPLSIRGQLPALVIQFVDSDAIVRQKVVGFNEMLPYLRYLKSKADSLGKVIICLPNTTYDKKIVITFGDPPIAEATGNFVIANQSTVPELVINHIELPGGGAFPVSYAPYVGYNLGYVLSQGEQLRGRLTDPNIIGGSVQVWFDSTALVDTNVQIITFGSILHSVTGVIPSGGGFIEVQVDVFTNESLFILVQSPPTIDPPPPTGNLSFVVSDNSPNLISVDNTGPWYTAAPGQFPVVNGGNSPVSTTHIGKLTAVTGVVDLALVAVQIQMSGTSFGVLTTFADPSGAFAFDPVAILAGDDVVITVTALF